MVFGFDSGANDKAAKKDKKSKDAPKASDNQSNEAAEMLKKMEAKKAAGDCPFC